MADKPINGDQGQLEGDHVPSSTIPKQGRGRPKGLTARKIAANKKDPTGELAKVDQVNVEQEKILKRHRQDCERLARVIKQATPGAADPKDIGQLARATVQLHDLERKAYDFGEKGATVKAVILIPTPPETMEMWGAMASKALAAGHASRQPAEPVRVVEDDVVGEPQDQEEGE